MTREIKIWGFKDLPEETKFQQWVMFSGRAGWVSNYALGDRQSKVVKIKHRCQLSGELVFHNSNFDSDSGKTDVRIVVSRPSPRSPHLRLKEQVSKVDDLLYRLNSVPVPIGRKLIQETFPDGLAIEYQQQWAFVDELLNKLQAIAQGAA